MKRVLIFWFIVVFLPKTEMTKAKCSSHYFKLQHCPDWHFCDFSRQECMPCHGCGDLRSQSNGPKHNCKGPVECTHGLPPLYCPELEKLYSSTTINYFPNYTPAALGSNATVSCLIGGSEHRQILQCTAWLASHGNYTGYDHGWKGNMTCVRVVTTPEIQHPATSTVTVSEVTDTNSRVDTVTILTSTLVALALLCVLVTVIARFYCGGKDKKSAHGDAKVGTQTQKLISQCSAESGLTVEEESVSEPCMCPVQESCAGRAENPFTRLGRSLAGSIASTPSVDMPTDVIGVSLPQRDGGSSTTIDSTTRAKQPASEPDRTSDSEHVLSTNNDWNSHSKLFKACQHGGKIDPEDPSQTPFTQDLAHDPIVKKADCAASETDEPETYVKQVECTDRSEVSKDSMDVKNMIADDDHGTDDGSDVVRDDQTLAKLLPSTSDCTMASLSSQSSNDMEISESEPDANAIFNQNANNERNSIENRPRDPVMHEDICASISTNHSSVLSSVQIRPDFTLDIDIHSDSLESGVATDNSHSSGLHRHARQAIEQDADFNDSISFSL